MHFLTLISLLTAVFAVTKGFYNPIVSKGQDPSAKFYNGSYYLVQSVNDDHIDVMRSVKLEDLGNAAERVTVWTPTAPAGEDGCCVVWAPELVFFEEENRWYVYYAASNGDTDSHRTYALRGAPTGDPLGPYEYVGKMDLRPDEYAIDSTVVTIDGQHYFVWSGWDNVDNHLQNLYAATLSGPTNVTSERNLISTPTNSWEGTINEGAAPLAHDGDTFMTFSASGGDDYCLGLLKYVGGDPLSTASWQKNNDGPVFFKNPSESVYQTGHNSFTQSPDGLETWLVYHATEQSNGGWGNRSVRAQKINWDSDDNPVFPIAVGFDTWLDSPSGE